MALCIDPGGHDEGVGLRCGRHGVTGGVEARRTHQHSITCPARHGHGQSTLQSSFACLVRLELGFWFFSHGKFVYILVNFCVFFFTWSSLFKIMFCALYIFLCLDRQLAAIDILFVVGVSVRSSFFSTISCKPFTRILPNLQLRCNRGHKLNV